MDNLPYIIESLDMFPGLKDKLTLTHIFQLLRQLALAKNLITLVQQAKHDPQIAPDFLPASLIDFLSISLELDTEAVEQCWAVLRDLAWDDDYMARLQADPKEALWQHGRCTSLSLSSIPAVLTRIPASACIELYPPHQFCRSEKCKHRKKLDKEEVV